MKLNNRAIIILMVLITVMLIGSACRSIQDEDSIYSKEGDSINSSVNEDAELEEILTLNELKNILKTSRSIEAKDINNQTIGILNTGKNINQIITDIFYHNVVEDYEYTSDEELVAIISFYPLSGDPIYALMKERFLYIEGYYFTSETDSIQSIIEYFRTNNEEEPIV